MKKIYSLILSLFFINSLSQESEEPVIIVPENPEELVVESIDLQSGTIESLQKTQAQIDKLDTESKKLTNEYKDTIVEFEILNKYDNQLESIAKIKVLDLDS